MTPKTKLFRSFSSLESLGSLAGVARAAATPPPPRAFQKGRPGVSQWKETTLEETTDLLTGFPFKSANYTKDESGIALVRGDNVVQGRFRWDDVKRWPKDETAEIVNYFLQPGDVILAMDRPWIDAGLKYACVADEDLPCLLVQRVTRLRARNGLNQGFLRYVIGSREFTNYVLAVQTGTAVPHISSGQIKQFRFLCPPSAEQRAIAAVLGALDDKIELNRRMNETLEALAQSLFKSWFVDATQSALPKGWRESTIGEEVRVVGGSTPSTTNPAFWEGGTHHWATPKDLSNLNSPVLLDTERKITDAGIQQISSGLLPVGTVLLSSRAPIGYLVIAEVPVAVNQGFIGMICDGSLPNNYVRLWTKANKDAIEGRANGTTFMEISKTNFRPIPVVVPPKSVLDDFQEQVEPLHRRVVSNLKESRTLAALRDALLPKLLSGELRVPAKLGSLDL
jgi:type I restriction enzyme S subunit